MKTKHLLLLLLPYILGCTEVTTKHNTESKKHNDTTYLGLYFTRVDETKNTTDGELLVFGKYASGKYYQVTDYDTSTQISITERKSILQNNKQFTTYYKGKFLTDIQIGNIITSNYDCEELTVGLCTNNIITNFLRKRENEYSQTRTGSIGGTEIQYSLNNIFALSSNVSQPENIIPKKQTINTAQSVQINEFLNSRFKYHRDSLTEHMILDRKFTSQVNFKNEINSVYVTIATCMDTTKEMYLSLLNIFRLKNGKIEIMFEKLEDVGTDSWGSGYEFIDAVDIDSDKNPELIFRVDGYEWSGVVIYKYQNGKFKLVFETGLYGC